MQKKVWILVNSVNSANEGKNCKNTEKVQKIGKKRARVFPEWQNYYLHIHIFFITSTSLKVGAKNN